MDVNPAISPGPAPNGPPSTKPARPEVSLPTPNHGPALHLNSSRDASADQAEGQNRTRQGGTTGDEDLKKAKQLQALIGDETVQLTTYHDEASGRSVLEVRDQVTGDLKGQYPSEELLRLYAALRQPLVDQRA